MAVGARGWPPTEEAVVLAEVPGPEDEFGEPGEPEWEPEATARVVVAPTTGESLPPDERPDGTRAELTLHFPETFEGSLRGRRVRLRGRDWEVMGSPEPYAQGVNGFNRPVHVALVEG